MDYYSVLGVSKTASQDDIRKAYKKKSMQHHPDRGGDEEEFKKVNEAYQNLSDPQKRAAYDNPQPQYRYNSSNPFNGGMGGNFEDIFAQFGFGGPARRQQRNQDVTITYVIDFKEMFTGVAINLQYKLPSGQTQTLDAAIPPGVKHNDSVRYAGLGDNSIPQLPLGNLIVRIKVRPDKKWRRDGDNIYSTEYVDIFDLITGTHIEISTPTNRHFSLTIPTGTKPGTTFSISGHGVPNVNSKRPGNVYIKIEAIMPKNLNSKTLEKIREIKNGIN